MAFSPDRLSVKLHAVDRSGWTRVKIGSDEPRISAIVTRVRIDAGAVAAFAAWQAALTRLICAQPGFVSVEILPTYDTSPEWQVIQRFAGPAALEAWLAHPPRQALLAELVAMKDTAAPDPQDEAAPDHHAFGAVAEVITTAVEPGREAEFLAWSETVQAAQSRFPGYMGTFVQAPVAGDPPRWAALVRFAKPRQLDAWLASDERRALLDRADPTMSHWSSRRLAGGFGAWFGANEAGLRPPAWKQTALVLLVLFPVVMLEMRFLSPVLAGLPIAAATFIGNAISVALVSWPLVGLAQRAMAWWLDPPADHRGRSETLGALVMVALYAAEMGVLSLLF